MCMIIGPGPIDPPPPPAPPPRELTFTMESAWDMTTSCVTFLEEAEVVVMDRGEGRVDPERGGLLMLCWRCGERGAERTWG